MTAPRFERRFITIITAEGADAERNIDRLKGAVRSMAGVAIAAVAYEQEFPGLSAAEQERQLGLDADVGFAGKYVARPQQSGDMLYRFDRAGISQVRDLLVLGRTKVKRYAHLTPTQVPGVDAALAARFPDESYLDNPSPADVAKVCIYLDQVHAGVVPSFWCHVNEHPQGGPDRQRMTLDQLLADELRLPEGNAMGEFYDHDQARLDAFRWATAFVEARAGS